MHEKTYAAAVTSLLCTLALAACDSSAPSKEQAPKAAPEAAAPAAAAAPQAPAGVPVWTGDYPSLAERRAVRMLVVYSKTFYFIDKGQQRGITYEMGMELEKHLNAKNKDRTRPIRVIFIPVARDKLLPALAAGIGDIATGGLTVTPERRKNVDFTAPAADNVSEILVTAPDVTPPATAEELSGRSVYVRPSSAYHESLVALNARLTAAGKKPVEIVAAEENLEDEDILEMVNAGLVDATVVDSYVADILEGNLSEHSAPARGRACAPTPRSPGPSARTAPNSRKCSMHLSRRIALAP